jgi:hypothetical protein
MDLDNIAYIVIAIVLAIINAIAQKKKKDAQAARRVAPKHDPFAEEEAIDQRPASTIRLDDVIKEFNSQLHFEETVYHTKPDAEEDYNVLDNPVSTYDKPYEDKHEAIDTPGAAHFVPVDTYQSIDFTNLETGLDQSMAFDFEENVIESTAIGDAPTLEEEETEATEVRKNSLLNNFDPKLAVVYAEIINPKYI